MAEPITFVPWSDISELLATSAPRQELRGFDSIYRDIVDYIVRCTHRIWEEKDVGLIHSHYAEDCRVYTLGGLVVGSDGVIGNTLGTLQAFPDRTLYADHVIWSDDGARGFHTSHRITSHMTHLGDNEFGAASGRRATVVTIADCLVRQNRIYQEWLVRDNWSLAVQLGFDPCEIADRQALRDRTVPTMTSWWQQEYARARSEAPVQRVVTEGPRGASELAQYVFGHCWNCRHLGGLREIYSPVIEWHGPASRRLFGVGPVLGFISSLLAAIPDALVSVDHVASVPFFDLGLDVAVRWTLAGQHTGHGLHRAPSGKPVTLLAITHWRLIGDRIVEEWTVYDEIAVLRQLSQETT
jgi:hypothetical protein